jgi:hypothetical protein
MGEETKTLKAGYIIYFKCTTGTVYGFYCIKVFTDRTEVIDVILDQLRQAGDSLGLVYIEEEEFNMNIMLPRTVPIRDKEGTNELVGEIIDEGFRYI